MTNYEKIKNISKEELASFLSEHFDCPSCPVNGRNCDKANSCQDAIKKWLESEI